MTNSNDQIIYDMQVKLFKKMIEIEKKINDISDKCENKSDVEITSIVESDLTELDKENEEEDGE